MLSHVAVDRFEAGDVNGIAKNDVFWLLGVVLSKNGDRNHRMGDDYHLWMPDIVVRTVGDMHPHGDERLGLKLLLNFRRSHGRFPS
jgi:hypothetical protein